MDRLQQDIFDNFRVKSQRTFPYYYVIPKLHKLDVHRAKYRGITGKSKANVPRTDPPLSSQDTAALQSKTVLSDLSVPVAKALNSVIDMILFADAKRDIRRCWIIRDPQECIDVFSSTKGIKSLRTDDFTKMYTNIPHTPLKAALHEALDDCATTLAFKFACSKEEAWKDIRFQYRSLTWIHGSNSGMNLVELEQRCSFIIDNNFIQNGCHFVQQICGCPMGNEAIPPMANLYLYVKEKQFVEKRIQELGRDEVLRRTAGYRTVLRFIDDRISPEIMSSMLPGDDDYGMEILCTGRGQTVSYLGLEVNATNPEQVVFKAQDKQQKFQFTLVRFPSWHTCVPPTTRIGTVIGMLVRTLRLTTKVEDFFSEVSTVVSLFQQRGYTAADMKKAFGKFTVRHIHGRYRNQVLVKLLDLLKSWKDPVPITNSGVRPAPQITPETPQTAVVEAENPPMSPHATPPSQPSPGVKQKNKNTPARMVLRSHTKPRALMRIMSQQRLRLPVVQAHSSDEKLQLNHGPQGGAHVCRQLEHCRRKPHQSSHLVKLHQRLSPTKVHNR